ncbi:FtsK/SpoIIIE domain-containing protein [Actinomyces massiliensis]|uniref:FtsK/SpoIIIE domain-containing protein n=1 Tax=Actinomyces massiliensis TaxID=461393 RepID=UPI0028EBC156|nr:FtsK/SpoIIIE domain-containing protein [Actinomyces massiliensis]
MPPSSPAALTHSPVRESAAEVPHASTRAAKEALSQLWHLAVLAGPDAGLILPVPTKGALGRGEVLTDPAVSRRHLMVTVEARAVRINDAGSANGTRVRRRFWWRGLGARPARCREGALILVGDTVLELRRRPRNLTVPAPAKRSRNRWMRMAMIPGMLILLIVAVAAMRMTGRGAYGLLAMAPMVLMAVMRLGPMLPGGDHGRSRRTRGTGWHKRTPDPASLLLSLAVHSDDRAGSAAAEGPRSAWLWHRRRTELLDLSPGQRTALAGPGAQTAARWWIAQLAARRQARITVTDQGYRLVWGREAAVHGAELLVASGAPPGRAGTVRAAPANLPILSDRWWEAACELIGITAESALDDSALPDDVVLEDVTGRVDRDGIGAHWRLKQSRGGPDALPAVLGMRRMHQMNQMSRIRGEGAVRADLVSDGPHALVAGTTGSGKSELLIAWLFQLALDLPPSRLALILVDYKGGAAFGPLADLPHTAGVLTDLDPAATARALASLEAEVQRRERLLARAGAKDVTALSSTMGPAKGSTRGSTTSVQAPPRLVVVVDEFATLASQHPDILDSLVRVAAQGRSLGIHLILATQRPAGAVSPVIRANTTLRVCLRVLDAGDSRDVLGHDGAAALEPHPGRVLVVGSDPADEGGPAQAPWCGSTSHLEALVAEVRAATKNSSPPWRPWAPPLPTSISAEEAAALGPATSPADGPILAATDHPREQRLGHWRWSVDRPLGVFGSPGSGRTTTALTVVTSALETNLAVSLCVAGAMPPQLAAITGPGLGTVVGPEDPRRLARLWSLAVSGELAGELLVIDDVDAMTSAVDEVLGPGEGQALLEIVVRTAPATRTGLVLTAPLAMAGARWAARIGLHLVLGAPQPAQAAVAGLPRGVVTGSSPGRGVILDGATDAEHALTAQVVIPRAPRRAPARPTHRLATIPRAVPPAPGTWAVGGDDALPLPVPRGCVLVIGPPGSGRTTTLRALQRCRREIREISDEEILVVDDLDMAEAAVHAQVEEALRAGRSVLASASTDRAVGTYRGPLATLRERGDLVVLWPGIGPASQAAGRSLRPMVDPRALTAPGRGVLISRTSALPLQVTNDASKAAD